jgi:type II secretory pathway pseudopilin PulG
VSWEIGGDPRRACSFTPELFMPTRTVQAEVPRRVRRAFTLVEALAALALTAIAGGALLLGTTSSLWSTDDALQRTIAHGMAQQLMDEIVGSRYIELGGSPYDATPAPTASELAAGGRRAFDDIGDFNGLRIQPPTDSYGVALGTDDGQGGVRNPYFQCRSGYFLNWRQEVDVHYVSDASLNAALPAGQTSDYRAVDVRIVYNDPSRGPRTLAALRRIVTYVKPLSIN